MRIAIRERGTIAMKTKKKSNIRKKTSLALMASRETSENKRKGRKLRDLHTSNHKAQQQAAERPGGGGAPGTGQQGSISFAQFSSGL
jgi:hypothetical protein